MNQIVKADFVNLISLACPGKNYDIYNDQQSYEIILIQKQQRKDYFVDDVKSLRKQRVGHKVFSDMVKLIYGNKCAITGINTKDFATRMKSGHQLRELP